MMTRDDQPTIFLFAGQGSQHVQMGRDLYERSAEFRQALIEVDTQWARLAGAHFLPALYADDQPKHATFDDLRQTHIAIVAVAYALAKTLMTTGIKPSAVLGVSIGEVAAMMIAGVLSLCDGVYAVYRQVQQVTMHCDQAAMLAVLSSSDDYQREPLYRKTSLAAVNFDQHFIVTGELAQIIVIELLLKKRGVSYQRLPVGYGFHGPQIDAARADYLNALADLTVQPPSMTYYSCATASAMASIPRQHVWDVVREPIRLQETVAQVNKADDYQFIDVGPGGTMATMIKYNLPRDQHHRITGIMSPFGDDYQRLMSLCDKTGASAC